MVSSVLWGLAANKGIKVDWCKLAMLVTPATYSKRYGNKQMKNTAVFLALAMLWGCTSTSLIIENSLKVDISASAIQQLKELAKRDNREIKRIEFTLYYHPADQAVAVVHYNEDIDGNKVTYFKRIFFNKQWPDRFETTLAVQQYKESISKPTDEWYTKHDLYATVKHRFFLNNVSHDILLEDKVTYEEAETLIPILEQYKKNANVYFKRYEFSKIYSIGRTYKHPKTEIEVIMGRWGIILTKKDNNYVPSGMLHIQS